MNTEINAKTFKRVFVSAIAISLVTLPLLASAADTKTGFFGDKVVQNNTTNQEMLYAKLKHASRDVCGPSSLQVTGSVERVMANNECYEETLTSAVERLNNPDVKELHSQSS